MAAGRPDAVSMASSASGRGSIRRTARDEFARSIKRGTPGVAVRALFDGGNRSSVGLQQPAYGAGFTRKAGAIAARNDAFSLLP